MTLVTARKILCLLLLSVAARAAAPAGPEVRFLCFAPSPYTGRHDAMRAGLGILLSLQRLAGEHRLPVRTSFYDGVPAVENAEKGKALLRGAQVLVFGSSTWAQGSSYYLRRYFELTNLESLEGVPATAWATAGGSHTGGEVVIGDTLRTLMGMGAQVFSLGQKYMVFSTGERFAPAEGDFTLLDCWYMEQFAKTIAVVALAGNDHAKAGALSKQLGTSPAYWNYLPKTESALATRYSDLRERLNAAGDARSEAYRKLRVLVTQP